MEEAFAPCRECGSPAPPPRPNGRRPPDLCPRCWRLVRRRQSERTPEAQEQYRKRMREYMRARRRKLKGDVAVRETRCIECGGLSSVPRAGSERPVDVCTTCWPRVRDRDPRRVAERRAKERERYASDSAYRERKKASSRASDRKARQSMTPEQRAQAAAYVRQYMRERRQQPPDRPRGERRAGKNHVVDLETVGILTRAFCACGWRSRALRLPDAALAAAERHFQREWVVGRILGQSRSARRKRELRAEGRCMNCGQPFEGETVICPKCRTKQRARERQRGQGLVASGMCRRDCGRPAAPGRTRCEECLEEARRSTTARRERRLREEADARVRGNAADAAPE